MSTEANVYMRRHLLNIYIHLLDYFADDTSLYIIVDNPVQAADQLNSDLTKIHQLANKWLVTFNPTKSVSIISSRKRIKPYYPPVLMDNIQVNEVPAHKHLGVIFSNSVLGMTTWSTGMDPR